MWWVDRCGGGPKGPPPRVFGWGEVTLAVGAAAVVDAAAEALFGRRLITRQLVGHVGAVVDAAAGALSGRRLRGRLIAHQLFDHVRAAAGALFGRRFPGGDRRRGEAVATRILGGCGRYIDEASGTDVVEVLGFEECAGDAAGPFLHVATDVGRNGLRPHDIGDLEAATWTKDAEGFAEDLGFIGREVDDAVGDDDVDGFVGHGDMFYLSEAELDVGGADFLGVLAGEADHLWGHVDAVDSSGWADHFGGQEAIDATPGAEVKDDLAGLEGGNGGRVAAAEGDICDRGGEVGDVGVAIELGDSADDDVVGGRGIAAAARGGLLDGSWRATPVGFDDGERFGGFGALEDGLDAAAVGASDLFADFVGRWSWHGNLLGVAQVIVIFRYRVVNANFRCLFVEERADERAEPVPVGELVLERSVDGGACGGMVEGEQPTSTPAVGPGDVGVKHQPVWLEGGEGLERDCAECDDDEWVDEVDRCCEERGTGADFRWTGAPIPSSLVER